jgi:hypothetical protein
MIVPPLLATKRGEPSTKGLTNMSYASVLRAALSQLEAESFAGGEVLAADGDPHWHARVAPPAARAVASEQPLDLTLGGAGDETPADGTGVAAPALPAARRSWRRVSPSAMHDAGRVDPADLLDLSPVSRQRGNVVHAWLAMIEWLDGEPSIPRDDELLAEARRVDADAGDDWLSEQVAFLRAALRHAAIAGALALPDGAPREGDDAPSLWRERPFAVRLDSELVRGTFDRVVLHRRGGRITSADLIDFKTDKPDGDARGVDALVDKYRPQLDLYRRVLTRMTKLSPEQITASLVFIAAGEVRAV